ncbi:MAG: hypothetical protein VB067_06555, partial [Christensenellaceae bacterium]|nr:hypothetical protein [Christensenellaceae bacterium]
DKAMVIGLMEPALSSLGTSASVNVHGIGLIASAIAYDRTACYPFRLGAAGNNHANIIEACSKSQGGCCAR